MDIDGMSWASDRILEKLLQWSGDFNAISKAFALKPSSHKAFCNNKAPPSEETHALWKWRPVSAETLKSCDVLNHVSAKTTCFRKNIRRSLWQSMIWRKLGAPCRPQPSCSVNSWGNFTEGVVRVASAASVAASHYWDSSLLACDIYIYICQFDYVILYTD